MSQGTIYDLTAVHDAIEAALSENGGELTPELEAALSGWTEDFDRKVEDYALVISEQLALAAAIQDEAGKLEARAKGRLTLAKRLSERLQQNMEAVGKDKVKGVLKTVSLQSNTPSVQELVPTDEPDFRNLATIAPALVRHTPESFAWDKTAIKDAAKAGTLPPEFAARVKVVQTRSLRIR